MNQYSLINHSILPFVFKIGHPHSLSYVLKDQATKSLILFPSLEEMHRLPHHIQEIQKLTQSKLTHVFLNSAPKSPLPLYARIVSPSTHTELQPIIIGDLSICLIAAAGYTKDYNLIAATHMTSTSTKLPVLFVNRLLGNCAIDMDSQATAQYYLASLAKVKYFPSETFIFPSARAHYKDLQFSEALHRNNVIVEKLKLLSSNKHDENSLITTTVEEEKTTNPFLQPSKYSSILDTTDPGRCFDLLREMRRKWRYKSY